MEAGYKIQDNAISHIYLKLSMTVKVIKSEIHHVEGINKTPFNITSIYFQKYYDQDVLIEKK